MPKSRIKGLLAVSPLVVFLAAYLVSSIFAHDFYRVPVSSAFLIAGIYAICITKGKVRERAAIFSKGAGDSKVLQMIWIFILAGAFAGTARDIGAVDATVNATLAVIPARMLFAGFFLTACFISMSIGTSVGTIVALMPIAGGIAAQTGTALPYMAAIIVGGAFFGDNLSFISDTTIAATRAMGCEMSDKFKVNIRIVLPAVIIVTAQYLFMGHSVSVVPGSGGAEWYLMLPYVAVIVLALLGLDVMALLVLGMMMNAVLGFITGAFGWVGFLESAGKGIAGMSDLIVVTMLAGGLLEIIRHNGGLDFIIGSMTGNIHGKRGAEFSIAGLVCLANLCTANNTIAIITTGGIAKDITDRFGLDPRKTASIMDTFSCLIQGLIPYGAQLLMAAGLAGISPTSIIPHLYYPFVLGVCAVLSIIFRLPKAYRGIDV